MKQIKFESNLTEVISETMNVLSQGGLVVFPSDTVYGLLVDATQEKAVQKLIAFKNRPPGKAISAFVAGIEEVSKHAHVAAFQLATLQTLLPGPYTLVLDSKHTVSRLLESEKGSIGLRVPKYEPVNKLMSEYPHPVTATSANLGGHSPHYSIESFMHDLPASKMELIDLVVDAGKLPHHKPSTVLDLTHDSIEVLRQGDMALETVEEHISGSPRETREIGVKILDKMLNKSLGKPILIVLQGDLGSGKTEMTRGIAAALGIEKVVSPTFVISYEYPIEKSNFHPPAGGPISKFENKYDVFVHCDLYNIEDPEEFKYLGLTDYLDKKSIMVIEWGERMGVLYEQFRGKAEVAFVQFEHVNEAKRKIVVKL